MRQRAPVFDCLLGTRDSFQQSHASLQGLLGIDIDKVSTRQAVLRDQDRLLVPFRIGQNFSGLPLQSSKQFSAHQVIPKWHFCGSKILAERQSKLGSATAKRRSRHRWRMFVWRASADPARSTLTAGKDI